MDFRWLHAHCGKSRCKMETLKKLRRLAQPDDWCFSFDLQDGYHAVGIDPECQEYLQFDMRGELFRSEVLPFGWNLSSRILSTGKLADVGWRSTSKGRVCSPTWTIAGAGSKMKALRARELASCTLTRLGLGRNDKKRQWEPTQLVEHLGLEVDLKAG
eukprot:gene14030-biopygen14445